MLRHVDLSRSRFGGKTRELCFSRVFTADDGIGKAENQPTRTTYLGTVRRLKRREKLFFRLNETVGTLKRRRVCQNTSQSNLSSFKKIKIKFLWRNFQKYSDGSTAFKGQVHGTRARKLNHVVIEMTMEILRPCCTEIVSRQDLYKVIFPKMQDINFFKYFLDFV